MNPAQDDINLASPAFVGSGDPDGIWRRLQAEDPVHLTKAKLKRPFWSITRHEDAKLVRMNDSRIFSIRRAGSGVCLPARLPEFEGSGIIALHPSLPARAATRRMDGQPAVTPYRSPTRETA
jgi:hypothetical protein